LRAKITQTKQNYVHLEVETLIFEIMNINFSYLKSCIVLIISFCFYGIGHGQEKKINNYKKWKEINTSLTSIKKEGYILFRIKNYENSKRYIESNYDDKTYQLYCDKIDLYLNTLKSDLEKGFSFSKILFFDSQYSKDILKGSLESILFTNFEKTDTVKITINNALLYSDIVDFKHNPHANPLNLTAQKAIRILDHKLKENSIINLRQTFSYHHEENEITGCPHIHYGAKMLSEKLEQKLSASGLHLDKLEKKIREHQTKEINKNEEIIKTLTTQLKNSKSEKKKEKLRNKIKAYETENINSDKLLKELFPAK